MTTDGPKDQNTEINTKEIKEPEYTAPQATEEFLKITDFENEDSIKSAKEMLNIVKSTLKKDFDQIDGTDKEGVKLSTYIDTNKKFQEYIKTQTEKYTKDLNTEAPVNLSELNDITNAIQDLIDKKIIKTLKDQGNKLKETKKEMIMNFDNIDKDGNKEHELITYLETVSGYSDNINLYKDYTNSNDTKGTEDIKSAYNEANKTIDDINNISGLKIINASTTYDELIELQTFVKNSEDFTEQSKKIINDGIDIRLQPLKEKEAKDNINLGYTTSNMNKTSETSTNVVETDTKYRNAMYDNLLNTHTDGKIDNTTAEKDKNSEEYKFIERLKEYNKDAIGTGEISDIQIGNPTETFGNKYKSDVRYTEFNINKKMEKGDSFPAAEGIKYEYDMSGNLRRIDGKPKTEEIKADDYTTYGITNTNNVITINSITCIKGSYYTTADGIIIKYDEDGKLQKMITTTTDTIKKIETTDKIGDNFSIELKGGNVTIKQKVENVPGTQDDMQKLRMEKTIEDTKFPREIGGTAIDRKSSETGINLFDDKGNYRTFEKYLDKTSVDDVLINFSSIVKELKDYKPTAGKGDANEVLNDLKNGYANVLTDYILNIKSKTGSETAKEGIITDYISFLTAENLNILGGDKATRIANYNKLVPTFNASNLSEADKKKIIELGTTIQAIAEKMIAKGFDAIMEQFGPMIFSILKFFGMGKGSLIAMFPNAEEKINKMFAKEYKLTEKQAADITSIAVNFSGDDIWGKDKKTLTAKEIKDKFTADDDKTYIKLFTEGKENYCKNINIAQFKIGIDLYNTKNKTSIVLNDVVNLDNKTGKSIESIKDPDKFEGVLTSILDNDDTRTNIAQANKEIQTKAKVKDVTQPYSESGIVVGSLEGNQYRIQDKQDIVRYLTASLFSSKDLSYVMVENDLKSADIRSDVEEKTKEQDETAGFDSTLTAIKSKIADEIKEGKYQEMDIYNFQYNSAKNTTIDNDYKKNILTPFEQLFTKTTEGKDNKTTKYYDLLVKKIIAKDSIALSLFNDPVHIANILGQYDTKTNTNSDIAKITKALKKSNSTNTEKSFVTNLNTDQKKITITVTETNSGITNTITLESDLSKSTITSPTTTTTTKTNTKS